MITKSKLRSGVLKYYLGLIEQTKWVVKDKKLTVEFAMKGLNIIGKVTMDNFNLEDCEFAIYDTAKLLRLIEICDQDLIIEKFPTKLKISDANYNLTFALANLLLIDKVPNVKLPIWDLESELSSESINNIVKAIGAISSDSNTTVIKSDEDLDNNQICKFIFGEKGEYNNSVTYSLPIFAGVIEEFELPFNSEYISAILNANKDMEKGTLSINGGGLMHLKFESEELGIESSYYVVRNEDINY